MNTFIPDQLALLIYWIEERERLRIRKTAGHPWPWTKDLILQEWRFCNVNRCDDRETCWIFNSIVEPNWDSPALWFNLCIARFINWSPTLSALGYYGTWDPLRFKNNMGLLLEATTKVYTGAYMIPAGPKGVVKHEYLADAVFSDLWDRKEHAPVERAGCIEWDIFLRKTPLMGDFLRNQIITDLKYTRYLPRHSTTDWETFILAGPGTQRGLNRLVGRPLKEGWDREQSRANLMELRLTVAKKLPRDLRLVLGDLNNLANCLCEFDKYMRVKLNEGQPRARYRRPNCL